jgi:hypothetical protein
MSGLETESSSALIHRATTVDGEVVLERELWQEVRQSEEWQEIHGYAKQVYEELMPGGQFERKMRQEGNLFGRQVVAATVRLAENVAILLEEPDNLLAPERNADIPMEGDFGSVARDSFVRNIKGALEILGFSLEDL